MEEAEEIQPHMPVANENERKWLDEAMVLQWRVVKNNKIEDLGV